MYVWLEEVAPYSTCVACDRPARIWTPDGAMCGDECADLKLEVAQALGCSTGAAVALMRDALRSEDPQAFIKEFLCPT